MSQASSLRGANAVEGYIEEEIERQLRQATSTRSITRSEAALAWADQIAAEARNYDQIVALIELLVKRGVGVQESSRPELDALVTEVSKKVGEPFSNSLANLVTSLIERRVEIENATASDGPSPADDPPLGDSDVPIRAYAGVWRESRSYSRGLLATCHGATWVATRTTGLKPGTDDSGWKMIAKGIGKGGL